MEQSISTQMEDFISNANTTLKNFNKKVNFFIGAVLSVLIFMLAVINDTRVEVVNKANASEVVFKQNAKVVEELRIANQERNFALVVDTCNTMGIIKNNNQNYIHMVGGIYDIKYRGE